MGWARRPSDPQQEPARGETSEIEQSVAPTLTLCPEPVDRTGRGLRSTAWWAAGDLGQMGSHGKTEGGWGELRRGCQTRARVQALRGDQAPAN